MNKILSLFNPDCETAVANGSPYYMASANIVKMAKDLALLPCWIYGQNAVVLGKDMNEYEFNMSKLFISQMSELFKEDFEFISEKELPLWEGLFFEPWGVTPRELLCFKACENVREWDDDYKYMYSRNLSRDVLSYMKFPFLPKECNTLDEIILANDSMLCIAKSPWSSSGRGILQMSCPISIKEKEWLRGVLKKQGSVMLEHKFDRVYDFAMEFHIGDQELKFIGLSEFKVGKNYEYKGNFVGNSKIIANRLMQYVDASKVSNIIDKLENFLIQNIVGKYTGFLGVDMFVYREGENEFNINPCVEINLRCNMGIVANMFSRKFLHTDNNGYFYIDYFNKPKEALAFHRRNKKDNQAIFKDNHLYSGYLNLTPVDENTNFIAYVRIDSE